MEVKRKQQSNTGLRFLLALLIVCLHTEAQALIHFAVLLFCFRTPAACSSHVINLLEVF